MAKYEVHVQQIHKHIYTKGLGLRPKYMITISRLKDQSDYYTEYVYSKLFIKHAVAKKVRLALKEYKPKTVQLYDIDVADD